MAQQDFSSYQPDHPLPTRILAAVVGRAVWFWVMFCFGTSRIYSFGEEIFERVREEDEGKLLGATWHRGVTFVIYHWRHRNAAIMTSRSKDGELVVGTLKRFGFTTPRGSSSRGGGPALKAFISWVKGGRMAGLAVDAPKGPAYESKPGIVLAASMTGARIVPVMWWSAPNYRIGSWDRTIIPLPFSKVVVVYAEPIEVPRRVRDEEIRAYQKRLDDCLNRLMYQTDRWFAMRDAYADPRDIPVPEPVPAPMHIRRSQNKKGDASTAL